VDPLAEKYPNMNPFAYAFNNSLRYIDPTGMSGEDGIDPPTHRVKSGETLWEISRKYGTAVKELRQNNNITEGDDLIKPGQVLNIGDGKNKANEGSGVMDIPTIEQTANDALATSYAKQMGMVRADNGIYDYSVVDSIRRFNENVDLSLTVTGGVLDAFESGMAIGVLQRISNISFSAAKVGIKFTKAWLWNLACDSGE